MYKMTAKNDRMWTKMDEISTAVITIHSDMKWMRKELEGNGKKGLIEETRENTKFRYKSLGALKVLGVLMGSSAVVTGIIYII